MIVVETISTTRYEAPKLSIKRFDTLNKAIKYKNKIAKQYSPHDIVINTDLCFVSETNNHLSRCQIMIRSL